MMLLAIAVAGGLGAVTRFWLDSVLSARLRTRVPLGTALINVSGSLALGLLTGWTAYRGGPSDLRTIAGIGFLGGYTTFSAASVETARLLRSQRWTAAVVHAFGQLVLSVAAAGLGLWLTSL